MSNTTKVINSMISKPQVQAQFHQALQENKGTFLSALIEIVNSDGRLQQCSPQSIITAALKAASWKLPLSKNFGYAYLIPRNNYKKSAGGKVWEAEAQLGYKGLIQLAIRTGQYRIINADAIREGEKAIVDKLTGTVRFEGTPNEDGAITGFFAHYELTNGMQKTIYWSRAKVDQHAKEFSDSFGSKYSPWNSHYETMAKKTVLNQLLGIYGPMSIEFQKIGEALEEGSSDVDDSFDPALLEENKPEQLSNEELTMLALNAHSEAGDEVEVEKPKKQSSKFDPEAVFDEMKKIWEQKIGTQGFKDAFSEWANECDMAPIKKMKAKDFEQFDSYLKLIEIS